MTRKRYETDEIQDEGWEEEQTNIELEEQREYEEECKIMYESSLTFKEKHFDQLYDMYEYIKKYFFMPYTENCSFDVFSNFVENPMLYTEDEYENPKYLREIWFEQIYQDIMYHYQLLCKNFPLFLNQKITILLFRNFCYEYYD